VILGVTTVRENNNLSFVILCHRAEDPVGYQILREFNNLRNTSWILGTVAEDCMFHLSRFFKVCYLLLVWRNWAAFAGGHLQKRAAGVRAEDRSICHDPSSSLIPAASSLRHPNGRETFDGRIQSRMLE